MTRRLKISAWVWLLGLIFGVWSPFQSIEELRAQVAAPSYGGIGILLDHDPQNSQKILIYSVTYKSPADKAKIKRGDWLLKVDGMEITGKPLKEIADKIRGPLGSTITLVVESPGGMVREVPLIRSEIASGPVIAVPAPTAQSTGVFLTEAEKAQIKQKILALTTDEQRDKMLNLLKALKEKKITKAQFFKFLQTDF